MLQIVEIDDIVRGLDRTIKFFGDAVKEEQEIKETIRRCEGRQQDILHEFEFSILSRKQRDILAKELKDIRIERRNAKNILQLIEPFSQQTKTKSSLCSMLAAVANRVREVKKEQEERVYGPRDKDGGLKINSSSHYEIIPTDNTHKFKVRRK